MSGLGKLTPFLRPLVLRILQEFLSQPFHVFEMLACLQIELIRNWLVVAICPLFDGLDDLQKR